MSKTNEAAQLPNAPSGNSTPLKKCSSRGCYNKARPGRKDCYKCNARRHRINNPISAAFSRLKGHAKERGISFTISKEDFRKLCIDSKYIEKRTQSNQSKKGNHAGAVTFDRIDVNKGYEAGNIQLLSNAANVQKMNAEYAFCKKNNIPFQYTLHNSKKPEYSSDPTNSNYVPF